MREIKFQYIFEDIDILTGNKRIHKRDFFLEDIEEDNAFFSMCDIIARRQYTGLKDKNGKEIYEGDIIIDKDKGHSGYNVPQEVKFGSFGAYTDKSNSIGYWAWEWYEIIGNIYENPNLLKNE